MQQAGGLTRGVEARGPAVEADALEVPGALRRHEDRRGQHEEQQRGQGQHFTPSLGMAFLSSRLEKLPESSPKKEMEKKTLHGPRDARVSVCETSRAICVAIMGAAKERDVTPTIRLRNRQVCSLKCTKSFEILCDSDVPSDPNTRTAVRKSSPKVE